MMNQPISGFELIKDLPTGDNRREALINRFANRIASYVETGVDYANWGKRRAMVEAITILFNDIGAAHDILNLMGIEIDLYETDLKELNVCIEKYRKERDGLH